MRAPLQAIASAPMGAGIIDGKAVAAGVRARVAEGVRAFKEQTGRVPGLATLLVGDDPASAVYVAGKHRGCIEVGIDPIDRRLGADAPFEAVADEIAELNADERVSGVLMQLPVPAHLDGAALTALIEPAKDVDGLTPVNAGLLSQGARGVGLRPCKTHGVMDMVAAEAGEIARSVAADLRLSYMIVIALY